MEEQIYFNVVTINDVFPHIPADSKIVNVRKLTFITEFELHEADDSDVWQGRKIRTRLFNAIVLDTPKNRETFNKIRKENMDYEMYIHRYYREILEEHNLFK